MSRIVFFLLLLSCVSPASSAAGPERDREAIYRQYLEFPQLIRGGVIRPLWLEDGERFLFLDDRGDDPAIFVVVPRTGTMQPLVASSELARALQVALGHKADPSSMRLISFREPERRLLLESGGKRYEAVIGSHPLSFVVVAPPDAPRVVRPGTFAHWSPVREVASPDGSHFAGVDKHNLVLRRAATEEREAITADGTDGYGWDVHGATWSPDSRKLAVWKVDSRRVDRIPLMRSNESIEWVRYSRAGTPVPEIELHLLDRQQRRVIRVDTGEPEDHYISVLGWSPDSSRLFVLRIDREMKDLQLLAVDAVAGHAKEVLREHRDTFIIGMPLLPDYRDWLGWMRLFVPLADGKRFLWTSERSGWSHLYLHGADGRAIRQLTRGEFPVVNVEFVDEKRGVAYVIASPDPRRPYDRHLLRVRLDGGEHTQLTKEPGWHDVYISPSGRYFVDVHSSIARAPRSELRRTDGSLVRVLTEAGMSKLSSIGWRPPEEFVVKADGKTDLYGLLYKPADFDPSRRYPVVEDIYGGPIDWWVPRSLHRDRAGMAHGQALAQLGFIVFVLDGRGTPGRSKAFQDVAYGSFGDHVIADHAAALRQLAERRPYMDLERVGIIGRSYGGYFAVRALLSEPDLYNVAVATTGPQDPHQFRISIEPYLGSPKRNPEAYARDSNLRLADRLKGKLLLIHGMMDDDVPVSETLRLVRALVDAGKRFDLLLLPDERHAFSESVQRYVDDVTRRYLIEHLRPE